MTTGYLTALPKPPGRRITEREWSDKVCELARHPVCGWFVAHFGTAVRGGEYVTPVEYDAAGFPDLVLVNPRRGLVWFRELKSGRRPLQPAQREWYQRLAHAGANVDVWHPEDWPDIVAALSNGRARVGAG